MIKKPAKKAAPAKTKKAMPAKKVAPAKKTVSAKKAMPAKKVRKYQEGGLVGVDYSKLSPEQQRLAMQASQQAEQFRASTTTAGELPMPTYTQQAPSMQPRLLQSQQQYTPQQERQLQKFYQGQQKLQSKAERLLGSNVSSGLTAEQIANRQKQLVAQSQRLDKQRASAMGLTGQPIRGILPDPGRPVPQQQAMQSPPTKVAKGGMIKNKAEKKIGTVMKEFKAGKLHSGKDGKVVKNPKQAIAIALSAAGKAKAKPAAPKKKK